MWLYFQVAVVTNYLPEVKLLTKTEKCQFWPLIYEHGHLLIRGLIKGLSPN